MKNTQYITIQGWMINELKLKGNDLIIYAIIHGFSQDGESEFKGSLKYLEKATNTSRPTVIKSLKSLHKKGFVIKTQTFLNNVNFNTYKINLQVVKKFNEKHKEPLRSDSKETLPNNTNTNNTNDKVKAFLSLFNNLKKQITGKGGRTKSLSPADEKNFKRLQDYTKGEFKIVIIEMLNAPWPKETNNQTVSHILRVENFNRYLESAEAAAKQRGETLEERANRLLEETKNQ